MAVDRPGRRNPSRGTGRALGVGAGTGHHRAMTSARGLLLDIGGVVLRSGPEVIQALAGTEPELADYVAATDFAGPGDALWHRMLAHEVSERAFWEERSGQIGSAMGHDRWRTFDLIRWLYDSPGRAWLNDDVVELMVDVKAAGLPLAALTNDLVDFHGQDWVDQQDWVRHFDVVVDASLTGVMKPDPRAFAAAVAAMGLPASAVVYLDDMPWNVTGGLEAGLQAIEVRYDDKARAITEARTRLGLTAH